MCKLISSLGLLFLSSTCLAQAWVQIQPKTSPSARWQHAMSYDPITGKTLLFGGRPTAANTYLADTWQYDGTNWTQLSPATSPPGRYLSEMVHLNGTFDSL